MMFGREHHRPSGPFPRLKHTHSQNIAIAEGNYAYESATTRGVLPYTSLLGEGGSAARPAPLGIRGVAVRRGSWPPSPFSVSLVLWKCSTVVVVVRLGLFSCNIRLLRRSIAPSRLLR